MGTTLKGRTMKPTKPGIYWRKDVPVQVSYGDHHQYNQLVYYKFGGCQPYYIETESDEIWGDEIKPISKHPPDIGWTLNNCKYCDGLSILYKKPGKSEYFVKCNACGLCSPIFLTPEKVVEYWNSNKCQKSEP
jgi:hypothetical protein